MLCLSQVLVETLGCGIESVAFQTQEMISTGTPTIIPGLSVVVRIHVDLGILLTLKV